MEEQSLTSSPQAPLPSSDLHSQQMGLALEIQAQLDGSAAVTPV